MKNWPYSVKLARNQVEFQNLQKLPKEKFSIFFETNQDFKNFQKIPRFKKFPKKSRFQSFPKSNKI